MTHVPRTILLRPLLATRIASQAVPVCVVWFLFVAARESRLQAPWAELVVVGTVALAVVLAVRFWRQSLVLAPDRIVIRGLLWDRTVGRDRVERISESGWLIWTSVRGRTRATPLTVLWIPPGSLSTYSEHTKMERQKAQMWARKKER